MHYFSYFLWQLCLPKVNNVYMYRYVYVYNSFHICTIVYSFIFNKKSFVFAGETKKSKINIRLHGYAIWLGRGTVLQIGDSNRNECSCGNFFFCLYLIKNRVKYLISPYTFIIFWNSTLHFVKVLLLVLLLSPS